MRDHQNKISNNERYDLCSVKGSREQNDDYGLFEPDVGACLADGVSSMPLGGVVARYGCQIALSSMKNGLGALAAVKRANELGSHMIEEMSSPGSGAAITVVHPQKDFLHVAWLGDVACFRLDGKSGRLASLTVPERIQGKVARAIGLGGGEPRATTSPIASGDKIILCTDGVWDELPEKEIEQIASAAISPRELCARLVLGRGAKDNATALALFF